MCLFFLVGGIYQAINNNMFMYGIPALLRIPRKLQEISPAISTNHSAVLYKKNGLGDFNFIVKLDGKTVYTSPDYMTYPDFQYRETLLWDETGKVLVLELMGKRVFAIEAETGKKLQKGELQGLKFHPVPSDKDFYAPLKDLDE